MLKAVRLAQGYLQRVVILNPNPSHMRDYSSFSERLQSDGANVAGLVAALPEERRLEVENILTNYLKKLPERDINRIWTQPVGKFGTDAVLYREEQWSTNTEPTIV